MSAAQRQMALFSSLNCKIHDKPLSSINPKLKFNHKSIQFQNHHSSLFFSTATERKLRRRFCVFNSSGEDSSQSRVEDDEVNSAGVEAALSMLRFYKREISPLMPNSCRYVPTCSEYSMIAYKKYGVVKGTVLTAWRLCRCNPLGGSGFDPPRWFDETTPPEQ
ncbi:hypothetical protein BUALT_Bualt09G0112800 [Buddleja alternifolia]|uniref:Membrane protein insertion efficiency factor n=1 Tax=Buddleja alternifolia TaxID=168488 RepID=A0AAV6XCM4_9LAMI|nr:hypothetical protein BUALT_Bualt09G0112800 [Buddleja alternifolia]